jgi:hypothetical protein
MADGKDEVEYHRNRLWDEQPENRGSIPAES